MTTDSSAQNGASAEAAAKEATAKEAAAKEAAAKEAAAKEAAAQKAREDDLIKQAEEMAHEASDAMITMMGASMNMMQSFVDMRLSYLKVMRAGLEDPKAMVEMASENLKTMATALNKSKRGD